MTATVRLERITARPLDSALEPSAGPREGVGRFGLGTWAAAGALVAGAVVGRLAMTGNPFAYMWAEDGKVFLAHGGQPEAIVERYAGYGLLVPRLLAAIGAQLPVQAWAVYAVLASSITVGLLAAFVCYAGKAVTGSVVTGGVAAAALGLTPALMFETLGSLANLQWFLIAAALWAFFLPPDRGRSAAALVAGLTAATTPLIILLLPAAVLVHRWRVWRSPAVWGAAGGLLFQAAVIRFGPVDAGGPARHRGVSRTAVSDILQHVAGVNVTGHALAWVTIAAVAALVVLGLWRASGLRTLVVASVGTAVVFLAVVTWLSGAVASRYVAGASMIAAAAVAVVVGACGRKSWAAFVLVLAAAFVALPAAPIKFAGPTWPAGVAAWRAGCAAGARSVDIPVSPPGWGAAAVQCR